VFDSYLLWAAPVEYQHKDDRDEKSLLPCYPSHGDTEAAGTDAIHTSVEKAQVCDTP
jgi:hypothetical protein